MFSIMCWPSFETETVARIMTDEEEFAARSQLKWTREGDAWILLYRRRRMGRVVPDKDHPGMWRSVKVDGILSDTANLSSAAATRLRQQFSDSR